MCNPSNPASSIIYKSTARRRISLLFANPDSQEMVVHLSIVTARLSRAREPRLVALIVRYHNLNDIACGACCVCGCDCDVIDPAAATSQAVRLKLHMMGVYDNPFGCASWGRRFIAADRQCR